MSDQCPCYVNPNTNGCMKYDSRFQATTVEEAIEFFEDMSLLSEKKPAEKEFGEYDADCTSKQCKICRRMLRQRLRAVGLFETIYGQDGYKNFIEPINFNVDGFNEAADESCERYRFSRNNSDTIDYEMALKSIRRKHRRKYSIDSSSESSKTSGSSEDYDAADSFDTSDSRARYRGRKRRQATGTTVTPQNVDLIGTRYNLSCTKKGSAVDGNPDTGYISLCSKCWAWRQLPSNYFPQFVNEMVCHDGDSDCLSGYATCGTAHRTVEVMRNDTNKLTMVTLTAGSYCECQVKAGSAITNLVTGPTTTAVG